ncbi:TPA: hypothetical protein K8N17_003002 [Clostridium perfringens]|jgi:hypothetical protein|uniref:hypothetical protein n=1 Tax=Clostridia TaxID=186801 RepID=UPI001159225B|nr:MULTISPECIES: hypothetical protein [Clostridiaceae]EJT5915418.1 hypothetical protein [Clostridium perfringens]EJT6615255.1 hypothetical protein [Clostridium perfringens]MBS5954904.1 hypothetical protein [Paraclostridium bifermentans]MDH5096490.1 hypothetical protein [Clostridium perfringens]HAT4091344.1 hypothetical protein [Clostridium perfringens]
MFNLYKEFLKYEYNELQELFKMAKTKDEQDFYMALANLKLQKEQRKVIGNYIEIGKTLNEILNWVKSEENRLKIPDSKTFYFSDEKDNDNYDFKIFKVFNSDEDIKHLRDIIKTEIEGVNNQYSIFKIIVNVRFGSLNFYFRNKKI